MPLNVNNPEADALTRKFARMAGVGITDAIITAMKEAIARRRGAETPRETAAKLREKHGISLGRKAREPLPRQSFDEMWEDEPGVEG
jgi:antitoxin VapB